MKEDTLRKYEEGRKLFENGTTLSEIGKLLKVNRGRLAQWLREQGIQTKENVIEKYAVGKEMYENGASLTQIRKELHLRAKNFRDWLIRNGVEIRDISKKYTYDEAFFAKINTEEKAYWLGFLYADGNVKRNYRNGRLKSMALDLALKESDYKHLEKFIFSLKANVPITIRPTNYKDKKACRVQINSTKLCNDLIYLGCIPNKSLVLKFPSEEQVPEYLIRHFVRGYVDGDGWVGISTNQKNARIGICGTYNFLNGLQERMNWHKTKISKDTKGDHFNLAYGSIKTLEYLDDLYINANIYLDRKYEKYKELVCRLR